MVIYIVDGSTSYILLYCVCADPVCDRLP